MMNKCMMEIGKTLQNEGIGKPPKHNVKDPPKGGDRKNIVEENGKRTTVALSVKLSF